uniref:USP domain-containing protein n=1 Tax=Ditylenchus dipsaci TaxID=166011 RepID=A0A915CYT7_9BILA
MTCYLNSLIQTLYMTPEFRNAIYNWKFNGNPAEETKNIPYQLQKLFLLLQTSDKYSLETKELTASFGWESNDAYDQHDVQELCRLMFDALEHRWKKTENRSLIQDLYKGTIEDYVKCLKCKTEKVKPDVFLDLPLAVKQFGATESYKSVEEAMRAFIKPEVLNGNNQYKCDKCNSKQDAEKGLRITHFPYLLTIQLKRFDFDYNTLHRIKLNDRMSFPDYIDVNDFVHDSTKPQSSPTQFSHPASKLSYASMAAKKSTPPPTIKEEEEPRPGDRCLLLPSFPTLEEIHTGARFSSADDSKGSVTVTAEECWLGVSRDSETVATMLTRGKYIYELISIMVHQGNASGGHYFAYIKNVDQNRWFCFNDSSVQAAHMNDIFRTFGGPSGGWYASNNAYMLMYRQVDPSANKNFIRTINLPTHLLNLKEKLLEDDKEKLRKQRFQEDHIKVHYLCNEALYLCNEPGSTLILKNTSLSSVYDQLISKFEQQFTTMGRMGDNYLPGEILDNSRLIMCDCNWLMKEHIEDLENKTLEDIVDCEFSSIMKPDVYLMLDTVPCEHDIYPFYQFPTKNFKTYEVNVVDIKDESIKLFKRVCLSDALTIKEVKTILRGTIKSFMIRSLTYEIDPNEDMELALKTESLRIVIDKGHLEDTSPLIVVDSDTQQIGSLEMPSYGKVQMYIDFGPSDLLALDREGKDIRESKMFKIIERKKFSTKLKIILPSFSDYRRAGMVPQIVDPSFIPPTNTSSMELSNSSNSVTAVLPFPSSSSVNTYDSSYPSTSNTYSSGIERMESLISSGGDMGPPVSYSLQDPTPPPPYSLRASDSQVGSHSDQGSPVSSANNDCDEDRMDDMSPCVSTPKRSPEVSEGSGDEMGNSNLAYHNYPGSNMDIVQSKLLRLVECDPNAGDWRANIGYEPTDNWSAGATSGGMHINLYHWLVSLDTKSETPCIEVEVDRRQLCTHLKVVCILNK